MRLVDAGFGNLIAPHRVLALLQPGASPVRRLRQRARAAGKLIDATQGRKTLSILITDSDHVILSAEEPAELARRIETAHATGAPT